MLDICQKFTQGYGKFRRSNQCTCGRRTNLLKGIVSTGVLFLDDSVEVSKIIDVISQQNISSFIKKQVSHITIRLLYVHNEW